jgi:CAAX protease family protein
MSDLDPPPSGGEAATARGPARASAELTPGMSMVPVWAYLVITATYLVIVQGVSQLLTTGMRTTYAAPASVSELWRGITVPVFTSLVFVYAVVAALGWWRPVFTDGKPVRRWVWLIPLIMVVTVVAGVNYTGLARNGGGFTGLLALSMLGVGFAEEGMFRGLGVVTFRVNGFAESKVAWWTCVVFGLAHAANVISDGPRALIQVLTTAVAGYFFYLARRVSGGLVIPAVLHGLWDFGLISGLVVAGQTYAGTILFVVADVVLAVIVLVRRHQIEPAAA